MSNIGVLGAKVRVLRRSRKMTQVQLAEMLGISASYLNLIEHDKRPLSAALLIKLSETFDVDVRSFAKDEDQQLRSDLMEIFADPIFDGIGLTNADVRDLLAHAPTIGHAVKKLFGHHQNLSQAQVNVRSADVSGGPSLPSEEVTDFLHQNMNYFPSLETAAEHLWSDGPLDRNDIYRGLVQLLQRVYGVQVRIVEMSTMDGAVRRYVPQRRLLMLSEVLEPTSRNFQLAQQIGFMSHSQTIDDIVTKERFQSKASLALARIALANYFAGALLMPYQSFLEAAKTVRYDIDLLRHRFRTSFEQVCHRLTNMRRPGATGIPFHFVRVDIAGNISKRYSASGMQFARFSGACSRWNVFAAFLTPGMGRVQLSQMPDGPRFFSVARTLTKSIGAYGSPHTVHAIEMGCDVRYASDLVYADGIALGDTSASTPIGTTCRLCTRMDCEQRAMPSAGTPIQVDENVRGISFYSPKKQS
jgi:predicted transcriptional regulator/transcriptional regulator with XRE-family HTH domain